MDSNDVHTYTCMYAKVDSDRKRESKRETEKETEKMNWVYDEESKVNQKQTNKKNLNILLQESRAHKHTLTLTLAYTHTLWRRIEMKSGSKRIEHSFRRWSNALLIFHETKTTKFEIFVDVDNKPKQQQNAAQRFSDLVFLKFVHFQFERCIFIQSWWWWMSGKITFEISLCFNSKHHQCVVYPLSTKNKPNVFSIHKHIGDDSGGSGRRRTRYNWIVYCAAALFTLHSVVYLPHRFVPHTTPFKRRTERVYK